VTRRTGLSLLADAAAVVAFAALGRRNHDEGGDPVTGALTVAAPFLLALAVGWLVCQLWRRPTDITWAVPMWLVTVALGMLLRRTLWDRGTALPFVIVATLTLGVLLLGWRVIVSRWPAAGRPGTAAG
jgi:Protein of unknown function (DUF3054)